MVLTQVGDMQCPIDPRMFVAIALSGEQQEPDRPACVWVDTENCSAKYTPIETVEPAGLRKGLHTMHIENGREYFLVVNKIGGHVHVFKYPKSEAPRALAAVSVQPPTQDASAD